MDQNKVDLHLGKVLDFSKAKEEKEDRQMLIFAGIAMCLSCMHRWVAGIVDNQTSLFTLECPKCKECDNYFSIIPAEAMPHFGFGKDGDGG